MNRSCHSLSILLTRRLGFRRAEIRVGDTVFSVQLVSDSKPCYSGLEPVPQ